MPHLNNMSGGVIHAALNPVQKIKNQDHGSVIGLNDVTQFEGYGSVSKKPHKQFYTKVKKQIKKYKNILTAK